MRATSPVVSSPAGLTAWWYNTIMLGMRGLEGRGMEEDGECWRICLALAYPCWSLGTCT
jgi:hypothetical protein